MHAPGAVGSFFSFCFRCSTKTVSTFLNNLDSFGEIQLWVSMLSSKSIFGRLMLVFDTNYERFVPGPMLPLEPEDSKVSSMYVQGKMFS